MDEDWVKMHGRLQCEIGNCNTIFSEESIGHNSTMLLGKSFFLFLVVTISEVNEMKN